jgi:acetyl esterase/lipase
VKTARTPVVLAAALLATACGAGGGKLRTGPSVEGPIGSGAKGVWIFRPAGEPKRLVIFFHGQGGPTETTPANHRAWIDHLVERGAVVVYPRYELDYSRAVIGPAVAGVRTAAGRLDLGNMPVVSLGFSRGAALAVEYAAVAAATGVPVPDAIVSVNPVPYGEQAEIVDLDPIRARTKMTVIVSDQDPYAAEGAGVLLGRLRDVGFPGEQIALNVARSHGSFSADHLAPLRSTPEARAAYWAPTDTVIAGLGGSG